MSVISRGIGVGPFASSGIASESRMFNHNHRCFTTDWTGEGREDGEEKDRLGIPGRAFWRGLTFVVSSPSRSGVSITWRRTYSNRKVNGGNRIP